MSEQEQTPADEDAVVQHTGAQPDGGTVTQPGEVPDEGTAQPGGPTTPPPPPDGE